jgi:FAD-dependent urate hydroxylase
MTKAIIIGAGIGGLSAAIALQNIGYDVSIYEKAPELKDVGAGISLWANAVKALDQLGVGKAVRALGFTEGGGGFHTPQGETLLGADVHEAERRFGAPTVVIHRADLSQILRDAFTGQVHLGKVFTRYEESASGITAYFADGAQATADLLICADGIHSVLRKTWFPASQPQYAGYTAWRGVIPFDHARFGKHWGETFGRGIRFGLAPLSRGRIYWFATQNLPANTRIAPQDQHAYLLNLFGAWYDPIPDVIRATPIDAILQNDIYDIPLLKEWVRGRAALLGDSAHAMTPNMGQGGCQAIEDAVVLGKCLRLASSIESGLREYQNQRLSRANSIALMSRRMGQAITQANPMICAIRNMVFRLMPPQVQLRNLQGIVGYEV